MSAVGIREGGAGLLVDLDVHPAARETQVRGATRGARGAIRVDVAARPERGAANRGLIAYLETLLGPGVRVFVIRGLTSRRKTVLVVGITKERLARALVEGHR